MSCALFSGINSSLQFLKTLCLTHCSIALSYAHITLTAPSCSLVLHFSYLLPLLSFGQLETTQYGSKILSPLLNIFLAVSAFCPSNK